jgi:Fic family protein
MALPGFSISDLIQALGQVKMVYDAFFNEYTSSASQLRDLADEIDQFRKKLKMQKEIIDKRGLECSGYEAVQRTLGRCTKFLEEYKEVLDKQKRMSVAGAIKTAKFAFKQDEINQLRAEISRHENNILHFSVSLVL